jgi:hypothetical protein
MDYYSNTNIEEFDRFVEYLGFGYADSISQARNVYIKLEDYLFPSKDGKQSRINFSNHDLSTQELNIRFNKLLAEFAAYETQHMGSKQFRYLSIDLIDVKSSVDEELFKWSYFNHKFAASQGQDTAAMNEWHRLEEKIDTNKIAKFKARRETNLSFFMHIINNHKFFDQIIFAGLPHEIKHEVRFGLDIAEEQYLAKLIKENQAQGVCKVVDHGLSAAALNLVKRFVVKSKLKIKGQILANSRKLNTYLLMDIRSIFAHLGIIETNIDDCDFVFLINDLDLLSNIPEVSTEKPIFTVDLSQPSTPNYSYMLLRDEGFSQIFAYAKKRQGEESMATMVRSLTAGLMLFINKSKFSQQLAMNYMDDYFLPLTTALGKDISDFQSAIDLLTEKLEEAKPDPQAAADGVEEE